MAAKKRKQREEEEQLRAERKQRQVLETCYWSLSPAEQGALREQAIQNLLQRGMSREFLLESLVQRKVYKLVQE